jgi:hypothetical protein
MTAIAAAKRQRCGNKDGTLLAKMIHYQLSDQFSFLRSAVRTHAKASPNAAPVKTPPK